MTYLESLRGDEIGEGQTETAQLFLVNIPLTWKGWQMRKVEEANATNSSSLVENVATVEEQLELTAN